MAGIPPDASISVQAAFKDILERLDRLEQKAGGATSDDIARLRAEIAGQREGKPNWQDPNDVFPGGMISKGGLLLRSIAGGQGIQLDAQGWDLLLQSSFRTVLRSGYDVRIVPGSADESSGHLGAIYLDGDVNVLGTLFGKVLASNAPVSSAILNSQSGSVGCSGGVETTLFTYTLPGGKLAQNGDKLRVVTWGTMATNGNNKTWKLYFGSSLLTWATAGTGLVSWLITADIIRTGPSTQEMGGVMGLELTAYGVPDSVSPTETLSAGIPMKITGQSVGNNDIVAQVWSVEYTPLVS